MKKYLIFFLILIFCLSSCSISSKDNNIANEYDNSSFYDSFTHNIVETKDGYYNLYKEILIFIDKESYKDYLVTKEKNSLDDLLANEEIKLKSDAYFSGATDVFYEDKKIYLLSDSKVWVVDEDSYTKKDYIIDSNLNRIAYKGNVYYLKQETDPAKENQLELKSFNIDSGKSEIICELKPQLEDIGFDIDPWDFSINKLFAKNDTIYILATINSEMSNRIVISLNIEDKKLKIMDEKVDGYQLIDFYIYKDEPVYVYNANSLENEFSWAENPWLVKLGDKIEETGLLKTKVYSDKGFILTSFPGLATYKAYEIKENGIENTQFTITTDGKDVNIDDSMLKKLQTPNPKLTNEGIVLFSYGDGALSIIKEGIIYEVIE